MEIALIVVGVLIIWAFNIYGMTKSWLRCFQKVTRGDLVFFTFVGAILPAGFIYAIIELTRFSFGWDKQVFPRKHKEAGK